MAEFWSLTPRLFALAAEGHARRSERDQRHRAWLAWHVAALDRVKRLPKLSAFMGDRPVRRSQGRRSPDELLAMARLWNAEVRARAGSRPGSLAVPEGVS